jgi:membrane-associated PAP2 superfamily phosphatase
MAFIVRLLGHRVHYAWIVVGAVSVALLTAAGVRSMPGVLLARLACVLIALILLGSAVVRWQNSTAAAE